MAVREIKTTISLDGEQAFKNSMKQVAKEFAVMNSELKAISSQYDVTGDKAAFLAQKQEILGQKLSRQKDVSSATRHMLKELEDAYEDAGKRLDKLRDDLTKAIDVKDDAEISRLTAEVKNAEYAFQQAAASVQNYQIMLNQSISKENSIQSELRQTAKALESADREVEELGRDSIRAGRQIEDGIGEGAERAESSLRSMVSAMQMDLSSIRTSTAVTAISSVWDMATGAYNAVAGFVEGTAEYRRQLSFLEQNAATKGYDFDFIKEQIIEVSGITGEATTAIEGLRNLMNIELNERQFESVVDNALGAVINYPDISFESLLSDFQETISTGSATGQFAELLDRMGESTEEFNEALANSPTLAGDVDIALGQLTAGGLKDAYEQYKKNNQEIITYNENQAILTDELSRFGETLSNYVLTPLQSVLAEALKYVNDTVDLIETEGGEAALNKVSSDIAKKITESKENDVIMSALVDNASMWAGGAQGARELGQQLRQGVGDTWEAVKEFIAGFTDTLYTWETEVENSAEDAISRLDALETLGAISSNQNQYLQSRYISGSSADQELFDVIQEYEEFSQTAAKASEEIGSIVQQVSQATESLKNTYRQQYGSHATAAGSVSVSGDTGAVFEPVGTRDWSEIFDSITNAVTDAAPEMESAGQEAGAALTTGFDAATTDWSALFPETVIIDMENAKPAMSTAGQEAGMVVTEALEEALDGTGAIGQESGETMGDAFADGAAATAVQASAIGSQIGAMLAAGMLSQVSYVRSAGYQLGSAAASGINSGSAGAGSGVGAAASGAAAGAINAVLNIDGKTFARVTAPYLSSALSVTT